MLSHVEELARQAAEDADPPQTEPAPQEPELAEPVGEPTPDPEPETAVDPVAQVHSPPEDDLSHAPPRRRMRFAFDDPQEAYT